MRFDRIDAALEGTGQYTNKAYFFRGTQYVRYDWEFDREDLGYPQPITQWHLAATFATGIDAAVNGQGTYANKAYFFKAGKYCRYDWASDSVDLVDQSISNFRLPSTFLLGIDAALTGEGPYSGKTYFFKDNIYVRYDWASDTVDRGPENISAWQLPGLLGSGIDAAVNGRKDFSGKAYVFRESEYARYDWSADRPDPGYPHPIENDWKHGVCVWANIDSSLNVDVDARLREDDGSTISRLPYPRGTTRGQGGWDVGLSFGSLKSLARQLRENRLPRFICGRSWPWQDCEPLAPGHVRRLALNAHGDSGEVAVNGQNHQVKLTVLTLAADFDLRSDLESIRDMLEPNGTLLFMGCRAGNDLPGTALLTAISLLMPGRKIGAFSTIGFSHGARQARHGTQGFTEPGMRDTEYDFPAGSENEEDQRYGPTWNDLNALPWAWEGSPHAKVALNGVIIRGAEL